MERTIAEDITIIDDLIPEQDEEFIVQIGRQNTETDSNTTLDICRVSIIDDDCKSILKMIFIGSRLLLVGFFSFLDQIKSRILSHYP